MSRYFFIIFIFKTILFSIEPITPLPNIKYNKEKASLGKILFFDPILSKDRTISCASCHDIYNGGDDGKAVSIGVNGRKGSINSPTVLNSRFNFVQFWDGRAKSLKEQVHFPIENPVEMDNNFKSIVQVLKQSDFYNKKFRKLYIDGVTKENLIDVIVELENSLVTPSRFDKYLRGDSNALSKEEKEGYELFKTLGCISCHQGVNIGGNMFAKFGLISYGKDKNLGRYNITKSELDKRVFKVPTLRNIELTAPYFHNGSTKDLADAVKLMANNQLGVDISEDEVKKIIAFLKSLTGKLSKSFKE